RYWTKDLIVNVRQQSAIYLCGVLGLIFTACFFSHLDHALAIGPSPVPDAAPEPEMGLRDSTKNKDPTDMR
ncbi:MAG: hypothetical protein DMG75_08720, partial [Acidobacteria bacterium]